MGGLRRGRGGWAIAASRTGKSRARPDGTWARCWPRCRSPATVPCWPHVAAFARSGSARSLTITRSATSPPASACSRWSPNGIWTASQIVWRYRPAGFAGRRPLSAALWPAQPRRRRPTALLCTNFARRIRRRAGQLAVLAGPGQRVPDDAVPPGKGPACTASQLPAPAHHPGWALADQRRSTGTATGPGTSAAAFLPDVPERIGVPSP